MDAFFLLIAISVVFVIFIGGFLFWSVLSGQFDNVQEHARSILEDDDSLNTKK
ncbi:cbb3-type cytochrome oxidase assembly protein CcoS [Pelistega sp. NLN82]|uniref:Cbb3-type cytochrome oxidase assembly protein CcoS n=1 Tax=Pelistega ratti TaxID=2652177 RepID=A0A6L9Y7R7_9BURK|nr:cbb3-type cytochrome oxidase assembly protein CcoS [Pelistega ratti]NEN75877.1 cbb3-type cytochrome oxidase assembly protein CcoS [Pelistega ratti]